MDRLVGYASENIGEPSLWINVVQPGGLDHRVEHGCTLSATVETAEQPCLRPSGKRRRARSAALFVRRTLPPLMASWRGSWGPPSHAALRETEPAAW